MSPLPRALLVGLPLLLASGCKGCGEDKPYTPFSVGDATAPAAPEPSGSAAEEAADAAVAPAFAGKRAAKSPPGATSWQIDGTTLSAPAGRAFERGLAADFDADGKLEAVTWTLPSGAAPAAAGELWLHPSGGAPKKLVTLPGFVPSGPGCRLEPSLVQTGPRSVTLDVAASCDAKLLARSPRRALVVLAPLAERPVVLTLRVAEAAPGEKLGVSVDSTDRDGDGRDDVRLTVSVARTDSQSSASAQLVWFDRAAGVSRDPSEPAGSIGRVASLAVIRAKNKKNAETVPALVDTTRRLMSALCAEGGVARVFDGDGNALGCGKLGVVVDRLALGEVRAAATRGDALALFGAIARDGWYFGKSSEKNSKELVKIAEGASTRLDARVQTLEARPPARTDAPRFSPLAFDASGTLSVQTGAGIVRVASDGSERSDADAGASWALEPSSDGGARWSGIAYACDRNEVLLTASAAAGAPAVEPLVTNLHAPRPGACKGAGPPKTTAPAPLAWKTSGLEALVALAHVGPKTSVAEAVLRPHVPGTPRSPDGRLMAAPTPLGVLVIGTQKPELWRAATLADWTSLSDCTVANDARAVACVSAGRVLLLSRP